jgi:hypothetical protein
VRGVQGMRGGKVIELKSAVDTALASCPLVKVGYQMICIRSVMLNFESSAHYLERKLLLVPAERITVPSIFRAW